MEITIKGKPLAECTDAELLEFMTLFTLRGQADSISNEADEFVMTALIDELSRRNIEYP